MADATSFGGRPRLLLDGNVRSFRLTPFEAIALLTMALVAAFVGYSAYARATNLNSTPAAAPTYLPAFRTTLTSSVSATGTVAATQQVTLTFASPGKITQMLARLGDQVKAGQALAKLEDAELLQALRFAQANQVAAQARYTAAIDAPSEADVATAEQSVASSRGQVATAQKNLDDTLAKPTPSELSTAQQAVGTAQNAVQTAQDARTKAQNQITIDQNAITVAQNGVTSAQNNVDSAETSLSTAESNLSTADQAVTDAQREVATARSNLSYGRTQVSSALTACAPNMTVSIPSVPSGTSQATSIRPLPFGFKCLPGGTEDSAALSALTAQIGNFNSAVGQYNTAVSSITARQQALTTAQNSVTTAKNAVSTAQGALSKAQIDLQTAQQTLTTDQAKLSDGSLERAIQNAQLGVTAAQQKLTETQAGATAAEKESARRGLESAQAALKAAESKYEELFKPPELDVTAPLLATIAQADANVAAAQEALDAATITAPFDGSISQVTGDVGTSVTATTGVFILVNPNLIRVDANVDQADITNLRVGQTATVTFDSLAGRAYQATVTAIGLNPTITQGVVTYVVQLGIDTSRLPPETPVPTPGMTASISVTTNRAENALVVPSRAVRRVGRSQTVTVKKADGDEQRNITTGVTNGTLLQVLTGLQDGEEVLVSAPAAQRTTTTPTGPQTFFPGGGAPAGGNPFAPPAPGR